MFTFVVTAVAAFIYFHLNFLLLVLVDENVSAPYMDEIFHVPQAQQYCLGNYNEWNDKITTLPGLYLLSTSAIRLAAYALGSTDASSLCNLFYLRASNVVLSTITFIVIFKITCHLNAKRIENNKSSILLSLFSALTVSLFPLHYFFQFLFYTDVGSTLFVLLAYYTHLRGSRHLSSLCGAAAVLFRQTNIVWVLFCAGLLLLANIDKLVRNHEPSTNTNNSTNSIETIITARNKKHSPLLELVVKTPAEALTKELTEPAKVIHKLYREDFWGKRLIYGELYQAWDTALLRPYLMVFSSFVLFVGANNGIVVGDRSNHQASLHLVQLFYFVVFTCFFSAASFILSWKKLKSVVTFASSHLNVILAIAVPLGCAVVHKCTFEHPFLLADNRHYTFYIWSRVFRRHEAVRFALVPLYLACAYLVYRNLAVANKTIGWMVGYAVCVAACVVPQQLLEFRYFIVPYYMYRLNISQLTVKETLVEFVLYAAVNVATIYLFVNRVFYWPDSQEPQRFMW